MSNSSESDTAGLLNPYTPLAFLRPDLADELEAYRYVAVGTLGAFIWNILTNVDIYYKLLFQNRITLATVAYFASTISNAAYISLCVAFHVGAVDNCQGVLTGLACVYAFTFPATSLLFLLRVRAIYSGRKLIKAFFVLCWIALTGLSLTLPFYLHGTRIGLTSHCMDTERQAITPAPIIASAVFDSLVFVFISWSLLDNSTMSGDGPGIQEKARLFFGRSGLPALSRALLSGGQVYYLITTCMNIATVALLLTPSVPGLYHALLNVPNSAVTCAMACKVYTDLKFGSYSDWRVESIKSPMAFVPARRTCTSSLPPEMSTSARGKKPTPGGKYPSRDVIWEPYAHNTFPVGDV